MTTSHHILYDVLDQLAIHLIALLSANLLDILLDSPDSPQGYIGMFYLVNLARNGLVVHKLTESFL